jgi:hypothetical protein
MEKLPVYKSIKEFFEYKSITHNVFLEKKFNNYLTNILRIKGLSSCGIRYGEKYLLNFLETPLVIKRLKQIIEQTNKH